MVIINEKMFMNDGDRLVIFRGTNGAQFLSLSKQITNETALFEGREYPLIHLECTVGTWHAAAAGYQERQGCNIQTGSSRSNYKRKKKDRKRLCEETPLAEFN